MAGCCSLLASWSHTLVMSHRGQEPSTELPAPSQGCAFLPVLTVMLQAGSAFQIPCASAPKLSLSLGYALFSWSPPRVGRR